MTDLATLSKQELEAALVLLNENIHQLTMAAEKVRSEVVIHQLVEADHLSQVDRLKSLLGSRPDAEKHANFNEWGEKMLQEVIESAPDRALKIQEAEAVKQQVIHDAVEQVAEHFKNSVQYELNNMTAPLDPAVVSDMISRYAPQVPKE